MERFDIVPLISGVTESSEILAKQFGADIALKIQAPLYVWSDEQKTETVFSNYLTNAIHYSGGDKHIEVTAEDKGENVRIEVRNTGDPIPEDSIDRIWDKFYKVDKARTREVGGTGVGLSIVKAVMNTLNKPCGVINYEDGVSFWFELEKADVTRGSYDEERI
jgi:signal transduction histidine kinase